MVMGITWLASFMLGGFLMFRISEFYNTKIRKIQEDRFSAIKAGRGDRKRSRAIIDEDDYARMQQGQPIRKNIKGSDYQ